MWSNFALLPIKIVDEINRLPETKQSMILDGVDRGNWEYLNDAIINREYCLFATANYQDRGTNTIIAPLVDRFDLIVESKHPGANLAFIIGSNKKSGANLRHPELEGAFHKVIAEKIDFQDKMNNIDELCDRFGEYLTNECEIPTLSRQDREQVQAEMEEIPFDLDANAFMRMIISELGFCHRYGQKRSHEGCEDGCHFTGYLCNSVQNCISNRFPISTRSIAQSLAWILGDEEVGIEHLRAALPYTLGHRIQWKEQTVAQREKESRQDPLSIYMAKEAVKDMHRRYMEQGHTVKNALAIACKIVEGEPLELPEGDHPIYWEIKRDLNQEVL